MTDRRLVEAFEELAARLPDPPPRSLDRIQQRASRRRTWRRAGLAAAALVLVAVGALGAAALGGSRSGPPVVDQVPATPTPSPPPTDAAVTMLLSPQPAPRAGGPLAVVVVNRSERDFSYGVAGDLEVWTDGRWERFGQYGTSLTSWHGLGRVVQGQDSMAVNDILLVAGAGKSGSLEWIDLPPLSPGWYRFTRDDIEDRDRVGSAILRVSEDTDGPQLTAPGDGPVLDINGPGALEPGAHELRYVLTAPQQNRGEDIPDLRGSMATTATLEVWRDSEWRTVAELDVDMDPGEPRGNVYEWAVQLPDLDAGPYRLVQNSNTAGPVVGHFWVTDLLADTVQPAGSQPAGGAVELPCAPIERDVDLPDSYTSILGAVGLPTADSADRALPTSHRENQPAPNYFAKAGLVVRSGVAFAIEVNEPAETAQLGWGSPADFGSGIRTDGCDTGDAWLAFAGGFLVDEPRCVEVTVRAHGVEETVQVGVGAPCEGQQPPPEPTDP